MSEVGSCALSSYWLSECVSHAPVGFDFFEAFDVEFLGEFEVWAEEMGVFSSVKGLSVVVHPRWRLFFCEEGLDAGYFLLGKNSCLFCFWDVEDCADRVCGGEADAVDFKQGFREGKVAFEVCFEDTLEWFDGLFCQGSSLG